MAVFGIRKFDVGFGEVHMEQNLETGVLNSGVVWDSNRNSRVTCNIQRCPIDDRLYVHASSVTGPLFVFGIGSKIYSYDPEDLTVDCRVAREPKGTVSKIVFTIRHAATGQEIDKVTLEYADGEAGSWFFGERKKDHEAFIHNPIWVVNGHTVSTTFGEYTLNIVYDKTTNKVSYRTVVDREDHVTGHTCEVADYDGIESFYIWSANCELEAIIPTAGCYLSDIDTEPEDEETETPPASEKSNTVVYTMFSFADTKQDGNIIATGVVNRTYSDFTYDTIPVNCIQAGDVRHVDVGAEYLIDAPKWTVTDKGFKTDFNNLSLEVWVCKESREPMGWIVRNKDGEDLKYGCEHKVYDGKYVFAVVDQDDKLEALIPYDAIRFALSDRW